MRIKYFIYCGLKKIVGCIPIDVLGDSKSPKNVLADLIMCQ